MYLRLFLAAANDSGMLNATEKAGEKVSALAGDWKLLVGAAVLIIAAVIIMYVLKEVLVNAIMGIIALLALKFLLGIPIPLTPLVVLVSVLGGVGGVGAILIATYLGWLPA